MTEEEWIPITECAKRHDVTRATIHNAVKNQKIPPSEVKEEWGRFFVTVKGCDAFVPMTPKEKGRLGVEVREARKRQRGETETSQGDI